MVARIAGDAERRSAWQLSGRKPRQRFFFRHAKCDVDGGVGEIAQDEPACQPLVCGDLDEDILRVTLVLYALLEEYDSATRR
jgi:hypothetical protein